MATIRKSITFTDRLNNWMQRVVQHGDYANESEYIRDLLRRDREEREKAVAHKEWVDQQLQLGLASGVSDKSIPEVMADVEAKMKADGRL